MRQDSFDRRVKLGAKKSKDYATEDVLSNFKRVGGIARLLRIPELWMKHPPLGYATLMEVMKLDRRVNILLSGHKPENESLTDTFDDQKNYTDLAEALMLELTGLVTDVSAPTSLQQRNANYLKGRAKEYRVMKEWREKGWTVVRSAGSHGLFDVIAISPPPKTFPGDGTLGQIRLIQCKSGKSKEAALSKVRNTGIEVQYGGVYRVMVELV